MCLHAGRLRETMHSNPLILFLSQLVIIWPFANCFPLATRHRCTANQTHAVCFCWRALVMWREAELMLVVTFKYILLYKALLLLIELLLLTKPYWAEYTGPDVSIVAMNIINATLFGQSQEEILSLNVSRDFELLYVKEHCEYFMVKQAHCHISKYHSRMMLLWFRISLRGFGTLDLIQPICHGFQCFQPFLPGC